MMSQNLVGGEGPNYGNNIGAIALDRRLERFRLEVAQWMEEKIFKPEAIWNGFTMTNRDGNEEVIYPKIRWNDLELRDPSSRLQALTTAQGAGIVSGQTLIEELGLNYDQEVERLRYEQSSNFNPAMGGGMGGGMPMGGGMGGGFGGGMGGGLGDLGGIPPGPPGPPGEPGAPPAGGAPGGMEPGGAGAPPPAPGGAPTANSKQDNYKMASNIIYNVVTASNKNIVAKDKAVFKSAAHKEFIEEQKPVTGRGFGGPLDKTFKPIDKANIVGPADGGPTCQPLNQSAQYEYLSYANYCQRNNIVTSSNKKPSKEDQQYQIRLFTKLEQSLYEILLKLNIPYPLYAQLMAGPHQEYTIDAAIS